MVQSSVSASPKVEILSPQRAGISLGIHAIVSKLTGAKPVSYDIKIVCNK